MTTMDKIQNMLKNGPTVVSLGLKSFTEELQRQGVPVMHVDWKPPAGGDPKLLAILDKLAEPAIAARIKVANDEAVDKMVTAQPVLVDIVPAKDAIPALGMRKLLLHAGPPVTWAEMAGPIRGAAMGACVYEGWAKNIKEAESIIKRGEVAFEPCHHHHAVGPMAGLVSPSMWMFVVKNETHGNTAYCTLNEGLGKVLRMGSYSKEVITRLRWMEKVLAPTLAEAVRAAGGIKLKPLMAQALQMGDECHNRNVAATSLFLREITPHLLGLKNSKRVLRKVFEFITGNNHFFLNLAMAAGKATVEPARGIKDSTLMLFMARNGTEIGMQLVALPDRWFTAPAGAPKGLYFPGFTEKDANPDIGDSTITEAAGMGAFAMAAAPAIVKFVGGVPADALRYTRQMYDICWAKHRDLQIPQLNFMGTPVGVDIVKVAQTGVTPVINTGIAGRKPGVGQVGAGLLYAAPEMFRAALEACAQQF